MLDHSISQESIIPAPEMPLKKGADGWRGIIGEGFTIDSVLPLASAIAIELTKNNRKGKIFLCHDARFYSEKTALATLEALASLGFHIVFGGQLPTPVATFMVREHGYLGAILITASHNPFYWNGVKLKVAPGAPPTKQLELEVEATRRSTIHFTATKGSIEQLDREKILDEYITKTLATVGSATVQLVREAQLKVAVDGLHGVAGELFERFFKTLGCITTRLDNDEDPLFGAIQPDPMNSHSRNRIHHYLTQNNFDIGFVTDGDGDRLCVLDGKGQFVWPHDVLALLLEQLHEMDASPGGVVITAPTGSIVKRMAKLLNRPTFEVGVGFKYAAPYLKSGEALLAGGAVGEFGYRGYGNDRDPLIGAIFLLRLLASKSESLKNILLHFYDRLGASVYQQWTVDMPEISDSDVESLGRKILREAGLDNQITAISKVDGVKFYLGEIAWLLIRNASTESGIRIYAEMEKREDLNCLERAFTACQLLKK